MRRNGMSTCARAANAIRERNDWIGKVHVQRPLQQRHSTPDPRADRANEREQREKRIRRPLGVVAFRHAFSRGKVL